jgi:hypothetical protein
VSSLPPASDPLEPAGAGEPERTASGLDATQIAPEDLAALQAQFSFNTVTPGVAAGVQALSGWELPAGLAKTGVHSAALSMAQVRSARMKLAPLPERVHCHHQRLEAPRVRTHRDLRPVIGQPIRRNRTAPHELSAAEQQAVTKALRDKYGSSAQRLALQGVYREVPLEAANSVRLDESLRFCVFTPPAGTPVHKLHCGYSLVVATGESGKTYPLLVRL